jgi:hypothetical protein
MKVRFIERRQFNEHPRHWKRMRRSQLPSAGWVAGAALTAGLLVLDYLLDNVAGLLALLLIVAVGGGILALAGALVSDGQISEESWVAEAAPGVELASTPLAQAAGEPASTAVTNPAQEWDCTSSPTRRRPTSSLT